MISLSITLVLSNFFQTTLQIYIIQEHPADLTLNNYNSRQCVQCTKKEVDDLIYNPAEDAKLQKKRDYKEKLQFEHTYSAVNGNGYIPG